MLKRTNKLPKAPRKYISINMGGRRISGYLVNKDGDATIYRRISKIERSRFPEHYGKYKYVIISKGFDIEQALRYLDIEVSAGGTWYKPVRFPKKTFKGLSISQIKSIQKRY